MLDFHAYKASVRVKDQDLPTYQPEYDEKTRTATCWIASEEGQSFTVFCERDQFRRHSTKAKLYLDGHEKSIKATVMEEGHRNSTCMEGVQVSSTERRLFQFASLKTTDDDAFLDRTVDLKALGTIRVECYRVHVTGRAKWKPHRIPQTSFIVHEKSKKAGSHITQLGQKKTSRHASRSCVTEPYSRSDTTPWVSFEFRYSPAAILQAEGIMPKPQVPHDEAQRNGESDEEMEADHKAEIVELKAEQVVLDARKAALEAKIGKSNIKRKPSPIRVPRGLEVIDLTLED